MLRKVFTIILVLTAFATAKVSFGVDFQYYMEAIDGESDDALNITPFVGIYTSEKVELIPSFGFNVTSSSSSQANGSVTEIAIEPGFGALFHILNNNALGFAIGPKFSYLHRFKPEYENGNYDYDKYYNSDFNLSCKAAIDLSFSKHFSCRLSADLIKYTLEYFKITPENGSTSENTVNTFNAKSIFSPSFGFIFTF